MAYEELLTEDFMAGGILAGAVIFILFLVLLTYIITSLCVMIIAQKTKTNYAWLAWIPVANIFLICNIAKQPWWIALVILLANVVPVLGGLISIGLMVFLFWKISERLGKTPAWSLLMILPFINLIYLLYLAFSENTMKEKKRNPNVPKKGTAGAKKKKSKK